MNFDELLKLAMVSLNRDDQAELLHREIARIGPSELTRDIKALLDSTPELEFAAVLKSLADLNQGRFEDLHRSDFASYIMSRLQINDEQYKAAVQALRTFLLAQDQSRSAYAARGAERELEASDAEFRSLIARRVT